MPTAPLDSLENVVNTARVRLNDAIQSLAGDILTDTAPFTLVAINAAWRRQQELLVNFGQTWLKQETILSGVAPTGDTDPGSQVYINWTEYNNGSPLTGPLLPQNLIAPLLLQERLSGTGAPFYPMDRIDDGLPAISKGMYNKSWEWRQGAIYLPGTTTTTDLRLRFAAFFPDFVAPGTTPFASQPVPILRVLNPFAWFICSEVARSRDDLDAGDLDQKAMVATKQMFDLDATEGKTLKNDAQYDRMNDQYSRQDGPASPQGKAAA